MVWAYRGLLKKLLWKSTAQKSDVNKIYVFQFLSEWPGTYVRALYNLRERVRRLVKVCNFIFNNTQERCSYVHSLKMERYGRIERNNQCIPPRLTSPKQLCIFQMSQLQCLELKILLPPSIFYNALFYAHSMVIVQQNSHPIH